MKIDLGAFDPAPTVMVANLAPRKMKFGISEGMVLAASAAEESTLYTASINPGLLVAGDNVIAVEIHQDSPSSSDISFNFELTGTTAQASTPPAAPTGLAARARSPARPAR